MKLYTQKHQLCSGEPTSNQNALVEGKKTCYSDLEFKIRENPNHANPLKRASQISLPSKKVLTLAPFLPMGKKGNMHTVERTVNFLLDRCVCLGFPGG